MNLREKGVLFLSSGGYLGNIPFAPGTFGSLLGLPLCFLLSKVNLWVSFLFIVIFVALAVWVCSKAQRLIQEKDPGCIVIDEISGMVLSLAGIPFNPISAAAGFIVFRLLDIFKPFPIRAIEKKISGGMGIVLDDVAAGIISNMILRVVFFLSDTN
ncbi:MAG: phosphatidylglycerophosphatase A [Desulfobacterales bacterium]|nr:phosphatidylglycerophosphatase A [Desulfobacterales bacterium]